MTLARVRGDVVGGVTSAVIALPLAIAFGIAAVTVVTVVVDLVVAVLAGLLVTAFLFIREQTGRNIVHQIYTGSLVRSKKVRSPRSLRVLERRGGEVRVYELAGAIFFGEMAILEEEERSATVRAGHDTDALFLSVAGFRRLVDEEPRIASRMLLGMSRELSYRLRLSNAEVRVLEE